LCYGFGDRAVPGDPPPNSAWVHFQSAGRLHLADAHPLKVASEL